MDILALETSSIASSIALLQDDSVVAEMELPEGRRTTETLAPSLDGLLRRAGWSPSKIQLIGVTVGPGSFTGLRIGVTTAKVLAYAVGAQVVGLNTLAVIAKQSPREASTVTAVLDAQRRQLFSATWQLDGEGNLVEVSPTILTDLAPWLASLPPGSWVSGAGLSVVGEQLPEGIRVVPKSDWQPRAATVGQLARRHAESGRTDDVWALLPQYYRLSAAEEKAARN